MGWLRSILGLGATPEGGGTVLQINLDGSYWAVDACASMGQLFEALRGWLPEGAILYFEGGYQRPQVEAFMVAHAAREPMEVAPAAPWPPPRNFHVAVGPGVLAKLAQFSAENGGSPLSTHFHIYRGPQMLLAAYDVLAQEMWLPSRTPKARVAELAARLGVGFRKAS